MERGRILVVDATSVAAQLRITPVAGDYIPCV
jgi:hypothetical protein